MTPAKIQKLKKLLATGALAAVWLLPAISFADTFKDLVTKITDEILKPLIPLIIGLAVVVFLWGVLRFIMAAGDQKKREEGRNFIIWGLVGITVMISIWGLVKILTDSLDLNNTIPTIPHY